MAMVNVRLYGKLRQFGRDFNFDVNSKREVFDALSCQIKGFREFMINSEKMGLVYAIFEDKKNLNEEELQMTASQGKTIRIAPIIKGSKSGGLFQVVLGVVLVAASLYFAPAAGAGLLLAQAGAGLGVSLVVGGLSSMLSPSAKKPKGYDQDGNAASYGFGGAVTTTAQGNPVAIIYGEREIGGAIGSAGIYGEDQM